MDLKPDSRQLVKVTIFHQSYTLTSLGDASEIQEVARDVDSLMHSIAERSGSGDASRVAVLACLHLADQMRELQARTANVNNRAEHFSALLEEALHTGE